MEEEYLASNDESLSNGKSVRDLEEILRGKDGVQSIMNSKIQKKEYKQTVSWETYLTKYIVFQRSSQTIYTDDDTTDGGESSIQTVTERYNNFVSPTGLPPAEEFSLPQD